MVQEKFNFESYWKSLIFENDSHNPNFYKTTVDQFMLHLTRLGMKTYEDENSIKDCEEISELRNRFENEINRKTIATSNKFTIELTYTQTFCTAVVYIVITFIVRKKLPLCKSSIPT